MYIFRLLFQVLQKIGFCRPTLYILLSIEEYPRQIKPSLLIGQQFTRRDFQNEAASYRLPGHIVQLCKLHNWQIEAQKKSPAHNDKKPKPNVSDDQGDKTVQTRTGKSGKRDLDAAAWVRESGADVEKMTVIEIKMALKTRNKILWDHGFDDWNRGQKVWPKKKPGKKSGN